jgi:ubiquitin-conjugating enzyme E2 Q
MGKRENRRKELDALKEMFPKEHERISVISARMDELHLQFKAGDRKFPITCSIPEDYPDDHPLWFSESENAFIAQALEELTDREPESVGDVLTRNIQHLSKSLCKLFGFAPIPATELPIEISDESEENDEHDESDPDDDYDIDDYEMEEIAKKPKLENNDKLVKLEMLGQKQNKVSGSSVQSTDRLMKDLKMIYKSDQYISGHYTIETVNDNLYHWKIMLLKIDEDSQLAKDLAKLSKTEGRKIEIELECKFGPTYPFSPPFIRVISPHISGGHVTQGGGLCMEILTNQGWSSAYSIESLLMQISASFIAGGARAHAATTLKYTAEHARRGFERAAEYHKRHGW